MDDLDVSQIAELLVQQKEIEQEIERYKKFYKDYLIDIPNCDRGKILKTLKSFCKKYQSIKVDSAFVITSEQSTLNSEAEKFISSNFTIGVFKLFNKKIDVKKNSKSKPKDNLPWWQSFLIGLGEAFVEANNSKAATWAYRTQFLSFLYDCLAIWGLHPNIFNRNPIENKRFNLKITHESKFGKILADYRVLMTREQFDSVFTKQYVNQMPIKIGGKLVKFESIHEVTITTTLLRDDEIELFTNKNGFNWNNQSKSNKVRFFDLCLDETDEYQPNPFSDSDQSEELHQIQVNETKKWLKQDFPKAYKLYESALDKYSLGKYERNVLDDMRLSLECFLKDFLKNNKPLEKQLSEIGKYLKEKGTKSELRNMLGSLLNHYKDYQNNNVKHDNSVDKGEVTLIISLTTNFMNFIVRIE